jgi:peptide/nickel transport system substrate-binding protein
MMQEVMLGYAVPATGPFNPLSKQYNPEVKPWPYDVARAKSLLKEAGFEDRNNDGVIENAAGEKFDFKLTIPGGNANYEKMSLFIKDSMARAGIVVRPDPLDWAVLLERLNKKNFEAVTLGWTAGIETDIYQFFHSSMSVAEGDNFASYKNEELDKLVETARRTINEDERMPMWRKSHAILHEEQPYTFLWFGKTLMFLDKRIQNVKLTKRAGLNTRDEWFVPVGQQRQAR